MNCRSEFCDSWNFNCCMNISYNSFAFLYFLQFLLLFEFNWCYLLKGYRLIYLQLFMCISKIRGLIPKYYLISIDCVKIEECSRSVFYWMLLPCNLSDI